MAGRRQSSVFAPSGHVACRRCGHPRYRHLAASQGSGCSTYRVEPLPDRPNVGAEVVRCACPGYQPKERI